MSVPSLQTSNDVILKPASSGKKLDHFVTSENPPETRSPKQKKTNIQSQSHWPAMKLNSSFRWKEHFFLVLPSLMSSECPFFLYKFWNISTVRVRIYWGSLHVLLKWYSVTDQWPYHELAGQLKFGFSSKQASSPRSVLWPYDQRILLCKSSGTLHSGCSYHSLEVAGKCRSLTRVWSIEYRACIVNFEYRLDCSLEAGWM